MWRGCIKIKQASAIWSIWLFYGKWTVESSLKKTQRFQLFHCIQSRGESFSSLALCELYCLTAKHKWMQLTCSLNIIIHISVGRKQEDSCTCSQTPEHVPNVPQYIVITNCLWYVNICILSVWQVQMHTMLESDVLSDCLARQHLHSSASSHHDSSSPLPGLDNFTGMLSWYSSKSSGFQLPKHLWKWSPVPTIS